MRSEPPQAVAETGTRVLVVDSDPAMIRTLSINLRTRLYHVEIARTGAGAIKEATDRPPALIILNLELPDIDGVLVIAALAGAGRAPIIVTSARDGPHQRGDAFNAGADAYLVKPFGMDKLLREVQDRGGT